MQVRYVNRLDIGQSNNCKLNKQVKTRKYAELTLCSWHFGEPEMNARGFSLVKLSMEIQVPGFPDSTSFQGSHFTRVYNHNTIYLFIFSKRVGGSRAYSRCETGTHFGWDASPGHRTSFIMFIIPPRVCFWEVWGNRRTWQEPIRTQEERVRLCSQ